MTCSVTELLALLLPGRCTAAVCAHAPPCRSPPSHVVRTGSTIPLWRETGSGWSWGWGLWARAIGRCWMGAESNRDAYVSASCLGACRAASSVEIWLWTHSCSPGDDIIRLLNAYISIQYLNVHVLKYKCMCLNIQEL